MSENPEGPGCPESCPGIWSYRCPGAFALAFCRYSHVRSRNRRVAHSLFVQQLSGWLVVAVPFAVLTLVSALLFVWSLRRRTEASAEHLL